MMSVRALQPRAARGADCRRAEHPSIAHGAEGSDVNCTAVTATSVMATTIRLDIHDPGADVQAWAGCCSPPAAAIAPGIVGDPRMCTQQGRRGRGPVAQRHPAPAARHVVCEARRAAFAAPRHLGLRVVVSPDRSTTTRVASAYLAVQVHTSPSPVRRVLTVSSTFICTLGRAAVGYSAKPVHRVSVHAGSLVNTTAPCGAGSSYPAPGRIYQTLIHLCTEHVVNWFQNGPAPSGRARRNA